MIKLSFPFHTVILDLAEQLVITRFEDGTEAHGTPHDTDAYRAHATEKSTGDTMLYAWQHDLFHVMLAEIYERKPSVTLWAVAHRLPTDTAEIAAEEERVQSFQRSFMMREAQ